jgi:type II secretory pathway pseudopilin PulG
MGGWDLAVVRGMSLPILRVVSFERGTTLVEVLVASALLVTLLAGVAYLFVTSQQHALMAERLAAATLVAQDRVQQLRSEAWSWDVNGVPVGAPALVPSPPGALEADTTGYSDLVDRSGRITEDDEFDGAAFVRRWAVALVRPSNPDALSIEVCVFQWPTVAGAAPLACLHTVRARQP